MNKRCIHKKKNKTGISIIAILLLVMGYNYQDIRLFVNSIAGSLEEAKNINNSISYSTYNDIPEYNGSSYVVLNNNEPDFPNDDKNTNSFEVYSELDSLGRCGYAYANLSKELMPTSDRSSIGSIKPSGWHTVKYDNVDGKYLYNRCHLIGYQLTGENANNRNLITCTRYMNIVGMLEFENKVANYIKETNNHVLYRVTPVFNDNNLLANGVIMEAYSIEDNGNGIKFNVFVYNVQDGINIDYKTGESSLIK